MKKARLLLISAAVAGALLAGCASQKQARFSPAENCVYIDKNGSISSALVKGYEGEAVEEKDLTQYLEAAVIRYNQANGGSGSAENKSDTTERLPAAIQNVSVKDSTMKAIFDYASVEDLVKFRDTNDNEDDSSTITSVAVSEVSASGADAGLKGSLLKTDGSAPSEEDLKALDGAALATIEGGGRVMFSGKVLFVTDGTERIDDYTVTLPDGTTSSIVFK